MPTKLVWTPPRDLQLKRLRAEGADWETIAAALAISRNAVMERARRIGARLPPPGHRPHPEDPDRAPLPPGHPVSWEALVAGTLLADSPFHAPAARPAIAGRSAPDRVAAAA